MKSHLGFLAPRAQGLLKEPTLAMAEPHLLLLRLELLAALQQRLLPSTCRIESSGLELCGGRLCGTRHRKGPQATQEGEQWSRLGAMPASKWRAPRGLHGLNLRAISRRCSVVLCDSPLCLTVGAGQRGRCNQNNQPPAFSPPHEPNPLAHQPVPSFQRLRTASVCAQTHPSSRLGAPEQTHMTPLSKRRNRGGHPAR